AGALDARLGFTLVCGLPSHSESKKAQTLAEQSFPAGILAPTEVLLEGPGVGARRDALGRLQHAIARVRGVARVAGPADQPRQSAPVFVSRSGGAARYLVAFDDEPLGANAIDDLRTLQSALPALTERAGVGKARISYAGDTALAKETVAAIRTDGLRVGIAVLLVNLALLAVFLRAVWAPLYLLAASALALAAALGATTFVMQRLLDHENLTYYVPFAAGVLLLSLGSDYNVFVVGKIWQAARDRPLREAIVDVAPRASSTI